MHRAFIAAALLLMLPAVASGQSRARDQVSDALQMLTPFKLQVSEHYIDTAQFPADNAEAGLASPQQLAQETGIYRAVAVAPVADGIIVTGTLPATRSGPPELYVSRNGQISRVETTRRQDGSLFIDNRQLHAGATGHVDFDDEETLVLVRQTPPFSLISISPHRDGAIVGMLSPHVTGRADAFVVLIPVESEGLLQWRCATRNIAPTDRPAGCDSAD